MNVTSFLKKYREEQNLKKIARRYGGQYLLTKQCCECDFYTPSHYADRPSNFGCHFGFEDGVLVRPLRQKDFFGHTCLQWKERTAANPIHVTASFPKEMPK